jgi:hypothetical protein
MAKKPEPPPKPITWTIYKIATPNPTAGCATGWPCAFKFHAVLPLTNSVVRCSPWIGIPLPDGAPMIKTPPEEKVQLLRVYQIWFATLRARMHQISTSARRAHKSPRAH